MRILPEVLCVYGGKGGGGAHSGAGASASAAGREATASTAAGVDSHASRCFFELGSAVAWRSAGLTRSHPGAYLRDAHRQGDRACGECEVGDVARPFGRALCMAYDEGVSRQAYG